MKTLTVEIEKRDMTHKEVKACMIDLLKLIGKSKDRIGKIELKIKDGRDWVIEDVWHKETRKYVRQPARQ